MLDNTDANMRKQLIRNDKLKTYPTPSNHVQNASDDHNEIRRYRSGWCYQVVAIPDDKGSYGNHANAVCSKSTLEHERGILAMLARNT